MIEERRQRTAKVPPKRRKMKRKREIIKERKTARSTDLVGTVGMSVVAIPETNKAGVSADVSADAVTHALVEEVTVEAEEASLTMMPTAANIPEIVGIQIINRTNQARTTKTMGAPYILLKIVKSADFHHSK